MARNQSIHNQVSKEVRRKKDAKRSQMSIEIGKGIPTQSGNTKHSDDTKSENLNAADKTFLMTAKMTKLQSNNIHYVAKLSQINKDNSVERFEACGLDRLDLDGNFQGKMSFWSNNPKSQFYQLDLEDNGDGTYAVTTTLNQSKDEEKEEDPHKLAKMVGNIALKYIQHLLSKH
jgi:hypothetical protein